MWYCVAPRDRARFERMAASLFPELHRGCASFLRHKDIMLSPALLRTHGIDYVQARSAPRALAAVPGLGLAFSGVFWGVFCAQRPCSAASDALSLAVSPPPLAPTTHAKPQAQQQENEFVVINAAAYHAGFNTGARGSCAAPRAVCGERELRRLPFACCCRRRPHACLPACLPCCLNPA